MVTTASYAPGVIALALSLEAVGSRARLRVFATCRTAYDSLSAEAAASVPPPSRLDVELMDIPLPHAEAGAPTHGGRGATLAVDAPRRALWAAGIRFVLLDCDMIALQNPDALLDLLDGDGGVCNDENKVMALWAVPAFRLKKRAFGDVHKGGGFNAGVMVSPSPSQGDADALATLVAGAGPDDTEESLLNALYRGRWAPLPRGYNVPKRVRAHAPELWTELVARREIVFLHFLGAKPWMRDAATRKAADWEAERKEYTHELEPIWWKVRLGAHVGKDGTFLYLLDGPSTTR